MLLVLMTAGGGLMSPNNSGRNENEKSVGLQENGGTNEGNNGLWLEKDYSKKWVME